MFILSVVSQCLSVLALQQPIMICDTCGYEFQFSGYKRHLTSTSNPKCRAKGAQLNPGFRQRRSTPEVQAEMLDLHFRGAPFAQRGIELQPIASDEEELPGLRDEIVESARDDVAAGPSSIPPGRRDMFGEVYESDVLVGVSADATGEDVERMEELEASQNRRHNGFEDPGYVSEPHSEDDSDEDEWEDCSSSEDEEDEGEETENSSEPESVVCKYQFCVGGNLHVRGHLLVYSLAEFQPQCQ